MAITIWTTATPKNWNDPTAWSAGVPGSGDVAMFPGAGLGDCTITTSTSASVISWYAGGPTIIINGGVTLSVSAVAGIGDNALIENKGTLSITGSTGSQIYLTAASTGNVTLNMSAGSYTTDIALFPAGGSIGVLTLSGTTGVSGSIQINEDGYSVEPGTIGSLVVSGITGQFNLYASTITIPGGQTLTMPSTPSWLHVSYTDSSNGGTIYAPGGTDDIGNSNWVFSLPHTTNGTLIGAGSVVSGSADSKTIRPSSGIIVAGSGRVSGSATHHETVVCTIRTVEVFDSRYQTDCTVVVDGDPDSPVGYASVFQVLAGRTVWLKGWDRFFGKQVVDSDGNLSLPESLWRFYAGLPYVCLAETLPIVGAPLDSKHFSNVSVRVNQMRNLKIASGDSFHPNDYSEISFFEQGSEVDMPPPAFTGQKDAPQLGVDKDATIKILNDLPYGGKILSIAGRLETGRS